MGLLLSVIEVLVTVGVESVAILVASYWSQSKWHQTNDQSASVTSDLFFARKPDMPVQPGSP